MSSTPPSQRTRFGREIEDRALALVLTPGTRLLDRNFRCRGGEVDLILEGPDLDLIFVEVRSRVSWPVALESIDSKKRRRISRAARAFLWSYRGRAQRVRMDVVIWEGGRWNWIRDAWRE